MDQRPGQKGYDRKTETGDTQIEYGKHEVTIKPFSVELTAEQIARITNETNNKRASHEYHAR